jgi:hypothetical protein
MQVYMYKYRAEEGKRESQRRLAHGTGERANLGVETRDDGLIHVGPQGYKSGVEGPAPTHTINYITPTTI